jgi:hypothetical protein
VHALWQHDMKRIATAGCTFQVDEALYFEISAFFPVGVYSSSSSLLKDENPVGLKLHSSQKCFHFSIPLFHSSLYSFSTLWKYTMSKAILRLYHQIVKYIVTSPLQNCCIVFST